MNTTTARFVVETQIQWNLCMIQSFVSGRYMGYAAAATVLGMRSSKR